MKYKKILFVGHFLSGFAPAIVANLRKLNYEVTYFDHYRPDFWSKILGIGKNTILPNHSFIEEKLNQYINYSLYQKTLHVKPDLILLFKCKNIYPETIKKLRKKGFIVINWFPDYYDDWIWISNNAANYDYFFTPCLYIQKQLKQIGVKSFYLPFAANTDKQFIKTKKKYQATFVGRWTKRREMLFKKVLKANLLDVWGYSHWLKSEYKSIYHGAVSPNQVKNIIQASKITLNTVTCEEKIPIISVNYRVFETTGVGGFLLSWHHEPLEKFYKLGKEIEVFHTADEALEKTKYYLNHDTAREKIARAGWRRTLTNHTYQIRLKQMLSLIK